MGGLAALAWRTLLARPLRTGLTVVGIALGVGLLLASLATSAGLDRAIERTVRDLVGRADLRVTALAEGGLSPASVEAVRTSPGVDVAVPAIERRVYLRGAIRSRAVLPPPVTLLGIDPILHDRLHDLAIVEGSSLSRRDEAEVVISSRLADEDGLGLGSELAIDGGGASERFRVVGIAGGDGSVVAAARVVVLPIAAAGRVLGTERVDRLDVALAEGRTRAQVETTLEDRLTHEPYVLTAPADVRAALRASMSGFTSTVTLLAWATLVAGAFLALNAVSMTVAERTRELGLLRAAGATRRQVVGFVLAGAVALGCLGAVGGTLVGLGLATLMSPDVGAVGAVASVPADIDPGAIVVAVAVGLATAVAAGLEPARRAGRIAPAEALRRRATPGAGRPVRGRWLVAIFSGLALLAGAPFTALAHLPARLARGSIGRDPGRAGLTVGALTVGLAMIVALGSVAQAVRQQATAWLAEVVPGEVVLTSIRPVGLNEPIVAQIGALEGVARVTPVGSFDLAYRGLRLDAAAVPGAQLEADGRLAFEAGDRTAALAALDAGGGVILPRAQAERLGLELGDVLTVAAAGGERLDLRVAGIVEHSLPGAAGEAVLVGWADATTRLGVAGADFLAVRLERGDGGAGLPGLEAVARRAALEPATLERIEDAMAGALDRVFGLLDGLAMAAVVVAGLGIVNTLTMNVLERVREIGMLRAAGMTRRQVRAMVVVEAGILGVVGTIVGLATGLLAGGVVVALAGAGSAWPPVLPAGPIVGCVALGVGVSMASAWYPAWLAGRVSIVRAVQVE